MTSKPPPTLNTMHKTAKIHLHHILIIDEFIACLGYTRYTGIVNIQRMI